MDVKVETKCGRCGKKHEQVVSLEKAQGMVEHETQKKNALSTITEFAKTLNPDLHPDVIVITKGPTGFVVNSLDNLCSKADAKRNKGCAARTSALIDDVFATPKPSKPRTKKAASAKEPASPNGPSKGKGK